MKKLPNKTIKSLDDAAHVIKHIVREEGTIIDENVMRKGFSSVVNLATEEPTYSSVEAARRDLILLDGHTMFGNGFTRLVNAIVATS